MDARRTGRRFGCHRRIGPHSAAGWQLSGELAATFHPYLTMAESLKLAAQGFTRDVARLSCCAA
jgi:hypothetical protein